MTLAALEELLEEEAAYLLDHTCRHIPKEELHLPGRAVVDRLWTCSDRSVPVQRSLQRLFGHGRLGGSGYLSMLPVDHGIAFSGGSAFAPNPRYFDPAAILELGVEGGCSAVVTTFGVLGAVARTYAHEIPLILKINHDEQLSYPRRHEMTLFARVREAREMGCVGIGATIYFGAEGSRRQLVEISEVFAQAHALGMATILFCYLHPTAYLVGGISYETAADLTGQANHLGVTIEADLIKQKQPTFHRGYPLRNGQAAGAPDTPAYDRLTTEHPIDLTRYQVANCYMGRAGLINSGGGSGKNDLQQAVRTAVINKRAGGMGLISGRKAFQRPMQGGVEMLQAIQDVYLCEAVTVA